MAAADITAAVIDPVTLSILPLTRVSIISLLLENLMIKTSKGGARRPLISAVKPDCACLLQRKAPQVYVRGFRGALSLVRFESKTCRIAAISEILAVMQPDFSAIQTCWRRERDSNPRYRFRYSGFQDRPFQPLTHPSGRTSN